jgi:ParB/RepB/Spo0J family partition protein
MQEIPLRSIQESKTNPRRQFDEAKLAELAGNIRQHGVLQPILVRPLPDGEPDQYELVAGARRYRASKLAGRETIPASIRELTDTQCLELQLIENLQRADVHELDEARGYAALMQLQPDTYTVETLAEKIGRSEKYVYARLRLNHLVDEVQQAFYAGKLTVAHAFEIARLQPNDQKRALQECFPQHRTVAAIAKDQRAEAVTVRELRRWIEREIHLDITNAPFDPQDEALLPTAGSCTRCPKRTGNNPLLFPEVRQKSICTDRACYRAKVEAIVQIRVKPVEEAGEKALRVSQAPRWQAKDKPSGVLYEGQYRKAQKKAECPQTKTSLLNVLGKFIPADQRVLLIEDTSEIHMGQDNLVRFEARQPQNGLPGVTIRELLKAALRHRPDRIILGEIRGPEAFDLLQLLNTGHSGSLSTVHATSARQGLARFTSCVLQSGVDLPYRAIKTNIGDSLDVVVHLERRPGRRFVSEVVEIQGYDPDKDEYSYCSIFDGHKEAL